ncbi:hypothetical protein PV10_09149 [Exophiala mesophila]|uniref:Uncharacterized protein n=1 Tax=Exophiala mesophila TaxID=212818 RepID=A0A0D1Z061_EXOME|nr:uncharacterized protein PV10_09149 [Exophiala mesophila]KIV88232.1 hypothetical protein PV10_09149 [Exophiala mesophila]
MTNVSTQQGPQSTQQNEGAAERGIREIKIGISDGTHLCQTALQKAGYTKEQAWIITDHLVDAELRGHPFAGLARALSIIEHLKVSGQEAHGTIEVTRSGPTYAHLDGHNSVGNLVAYEATRIAVEKAKTVGVSVVGAHDLWYSGNLAYYAEMATREDLIVLIASNGSRIVAPYGGYERKFCTNPFCIGFPTNDVDQPIIWDIGTSNIMYAQVKLAERLHAGLPEGAAFDAEGNFTTDPLKALHGALTASGGHKGSGLAMMVQLLGIAAGSSEPTPMMSGFGYLVIAFDPQILQPIAHVKENAEKFAQAIRETKMLPGYDAARMPYEGSCRNRRDARNRGWIQVEKKVIDDLRELCL